MAEKKKTLKFEDALKRLETLVEEMESGKMSLEQTLSAFEECRELGKFCRDTLNEVQKRIEVLMKTENGIEPVPFEKK